MIIYFLPWGQTALFIHVNISRMTLFKNGSVITTGAQIPQAAGGSFSTHCFRRGGAQYRFMFAPVGKRWTLRMVRWWGGWVEGEQVCFVHSIWTDIIKGSVLA
jgi:hypothetical protein